MLFVLWFAAATTGLCIYWVRRFEPGRSGIKLALYGMAFVLLCAAAPVRTYDVHRHSRLLVGADSTGPIFVSDVTRLTLDV